MAALLLLLVACSSPSLSPSSAASTPAAYATDGDIVHGWPHTAENQAGTYSWDGSACAGPFCVMGFMHNGYGSGDVDITIEDVPAGASDGGGTAVTVAGHDGIYRRIDAREEEWMVDIGGTTIVIHLTAKGPSDADLVEAHAIIESMRTEKRENHLGFRLVFTLTTDDWDSG